MDNPSAAKPLSTSLKSPPISPPVLSFSSTFIREAFSHSPFAKRKMSRPRANRPKDQIGTNVFYANGTRQPFPPLRWAHLGSPPPAAQGVPGSPLTSDEPILSLQLPRFSDLTGQSSMCPNMPATGTDPTISLDLLDEDGPYSLQLSPSTNLTNLMDDWEIFTPHRDVSKRSPQHYGWTGESAAESTLMSPNDEEVPSIPLGDLVHDSLIEDDPDKGSMAQTPLSKSPPRQASTPGTFGPASLDFGSRSQQLSTVQFMPGSTYQPLTPSPSSAFSQQLPSPGILPFRQPPGTFGQSARDYGTRIQRMSPARLTPSTFYSSPTLAPLPILSPPLPSPGALPYRQPSWSQFKSQFSSARRPSNPSLSVHPLASPLQFELSPTRSSRPVIPLSRYKSPSPPSDLSIFPEQLFPLEEYTFPSVLEPTATDYSANALGLEDVFTSVGHRTELTYLSNASTAPELSAFAAEHLQGRPLNLDFALRYDVRDEVGHGGFGFVCTAIQTGFDNVPGVEVAVKFVFKNRLTDMEDTIINGEPVESYVLRQCDHPGIIKFFALYEDDDFFYVVQELHGDPWAADHTLQPQAQAHHGPPTVPAIPAPDFAAALSQYSPFQGLGGLSWSPATAQEWPMSASPMVRPNMSRRASYDLFEAVEHARFSEEQGKTIFKQIVDAIAYLHNKGIYHRDLKDENIVIDRNLQVKIIDFGSACLQNEFHPSITRSHFRGTMSYAAAEVLCGKSYQAGPSDIWALGIILAIILTGESPFPDTKFAQNGNIKLKRQISAEAHDLMSRCLQVKPKKRALIGELQKHLWLTPIAQRSPV